MKILRSTLPGIVASLCVISAAAVAGCASDDGTGDPGDGDGDTATGGATSSGGGTATGGVTGTGGDAGTGGGSSEGQFPSDNTLAGVEAFLATQSYKTWTAEPAPHAPRSYEIHGDLMQVYFNDVAVATHSNADNLAMTVKELYDAGGVQVGIAAAWKADNVWNYYCTQDDPSSTACAADEGSTFPVYGQGFDVGCGFCHGAAFLTPLP